MAGFRYVDLRETLNISTVSSDILTVPNTVLSQSDQFNTRNQFYGGQLGGRINWQYDRFVLDLTGKLALGDTHQTVDIQGCIDVKPAPAASTALSPAASSRRPAISATTPRTSSP